MAEIKVQNTGICPFSNYSWTSSLALLLVFKKCVFYSCHFQANLDARLTSAKREIIYFSVIQKTVHNSQN
jgi:hypothetical protein